MERMICSIGQQETGMAAYGLQTLFDGIQLKDIFIG